MGSDRPSFSTSTVENVNAREPLAGDPATDDITWTRLRSEILRSAVELLDDDLRTNEAIVVAEVVVAARLVATDDTEVGIVFKSDGSRMIASALGQLAADTYRSFVLGDEVDE